MDIVITIHEKDLMQNPELWDKVKALTCGLQAGKGNATPPTLQKTEVEMKSGAAEPTADKEPKKAPDAIGKAESQAQAISIEELRAEIAKVSKKQGAARAKAILQKYGAESLSTLDPAHYAAAMEDAKGVI